MSGPVSVRLCSSPRPLSNKKMFFVVLSLHSSLCCLCVLTSFALSIYITVFLISSFFILFPSYVMQDFMSVSSTCAIVVTLHFLLLSVCVFVSLVLLQASLFSSFSRYSVEQASFVYFFSVSVSVFRIKKLFFVLKIRELPFP